MVPVKKGNAQEMQALARFSLDFRGNPFKTKVFLSVKIQKQTP